MYYKCDWLLVLPSDGEVDTYIEAGIILLHNDSVVWQLANTCREMLEDTRLAKLVANLEGYLQACANLVSTKKQISKLDYEAGLRLFDGHGGQMWVGVPEDGPEHGVARYANMERLITERTRHEISTVLRWAVGRKSEDCDLVYHITYSYVIPRHSCVYRKLNRRPTIGKACFGAIEQRIVDSLVRCSLEITGIRLIDQTIAAHWWRLSLGGANSLVIEAVERAIKRVL